MKHETRIAYRNLEGGVSFICPSPEFCANPANTIDMLLRTLPLGVHFEVHCVEDIPSDRYFRNAWKLDGGVSVDLDQAREIHMDKLRVIRNEKLAELDVPFQRALEDKDIIMQDNIATKKNKLRDMPRNVDLSGLTLEEIKAFIPKILEG